jgi:hypothetical protein
MSSLLFEHESKSARENYEYESNLFTIYSRRVTIGADITLVFLFHDQAEQPCGTIRNYIFHSFGENTIFMRDSDLDVLFLSSFLPFEIRLFGDVWWD